MSGLFGTFNIVKRGMQSHQTALHVLSHNISNANTDGYSVQRANFKTTEPFGMPSLTTAAEPGQLGTGVQISSITRSRDQFLDFQIRKEMSTLNKYGSREEFLSEIETIFMEPSDTGLATNMTQFWDSWHQLSTKPEPDSTARTLVAQNADSLANAIKHNYEQLKNMEVNAADIMKQQSFDVNSVLNQISDLNKQIKAVVIGGQTPNDLMDRRDILLDQLSERFNFDTEETNFGGIKITAKTENGQREILNDTYINFSVSYVNKVAYNQGTNSWDVELYVDGNVNNPVTISGLSDDEIKQYADVNSITGKVNSISCHTVFYNKNNGKIDSPAKFENGSLNGYETISSEINKYKTQLNNLARVIAISVNTIHSNTEDPNGGVNFFNVDAETSDEPANVISVNNEILKDPTKINAAKVIGGNAGNGDRALLIGQLRNTRLELLNIKNRNDFAQKTKFNFVDMKLKSSDSGVTMDSYFKDSIALLGVSNQEAKKMVTNQTALLSQLEMRKESISGVSLDEEMTNMLQFQRAYEANAKMISTIDQLLDVVVNGLMRR